MVDRVTDIPESVAEHPPTEAWIEGVLQSLLTKAQTIGDRWWEKHYANKSTAPRTEWGSYGVRARLHKGGLQIDWYRLRKANVEVQTATGSKKVLLADHVKKGKKSQYSPNALTRAVQWEQAMFEELEPQFAKLREQAMDINRVRAVYRRYKGKYKEGAKA